MRYIIRCSKRENGKWSTTPYGRVFVRETDAIRWAEEWAANNPNRSWQLTVKP
jgi:hypothetical protein